MKWKSLIVLFFIFFLGLSWLERSVHYAQQKCLSSPWELKNKLSLLLFCFLLLTFLTPCAIYRSYMFLINFGEDLLTLPNHVSQEKWLETWNGLGNCFFLKLLNSLGLFISSCNEGLGVDQCFPNWAHHWSNLGELAKKEK